MANNALELMTAARDFDASDVDMQQNIENLMVMYLLLNLLD